MRRGLFGFLLVAVLFVCGTVAYPHMAPRQACWSMRPMHLGSAQSGSYAPFRIVAPATYQPGQEIEVTLNATGSTRFKGFLLQARTTRRERAVGTFRAINARQYGTQVNCENQALCHTSSQEKRMIKGMWRAPATAVGPIIFKATFVENYSTCWVGVTSSQVSPPS